MERPGFNPQALAREPGSQRSGANKEKKQAARRVCAGGNGCDDGGACNGHGAIRLLRESYSIFLRFAQGRGSDVRWQPGKWIVRRHTKAAKFAYIACQYG